VVVAIEREQTPTVLCVRVPTRRLHRNRALNLGRPRAKLQIDLLVPSGDADRQIQINLPDGVSLETAATTSADMLIEVESPQPVQDLSALMTWLLGPGMKALPPVRQCLADLAAVKAETVTETLRQYLIGPAARPGSDLHACTSDARTRLAQLSTELGQLSSRPDDAAVKVEVQRLWDEGNWLPRGPLRRRTSATTPDTLSPRAVVARAGVIEDASQRAIASCARIGVRIEVTDAEFFSIARL
jgi:hypothetical protein